MLTSITLWLLCGVCAYLLGAVPFGFILAKMKGVDIRTAGSGNIGATNVFRSVSKPLGILAFVLDALKGFAGTGHLPLAIWLLLLGRTPETNDWIIFMSDLRLPVFCGAMTVAGHNWTCFLGFKGGKGIATSAGMLLALSPLGVAIALGVWIVAFVITRYVSAASIAAAVSLAIAVWPLHLKAQGVWFPAVLTLLALVAVWKHRPNIARLRAGTEHRFSFSRGGR